MLILVENGEVYAPEPIGRVPILLTFDRIASVGRVDRARVKALDLEVDYIDARGCVVTPGLIDPHEHVAGGSAEDGFSTQTPEISASEIVSAGITSVVGVLGSDTTMISPSGLLAKVKALKEEGLNAWMWTGGYNMPPTSITDSIRSDLLYIDEVIGAGEVAIADRRSTDPRPDEIAKVVSNIYGAGAISRKAGRTYFHIGEADRRLSVIRQMLESSREVNPDSLYLTHIERTAELMDEAIEVVRRGAWADIDVVNEDLARWLPYYLEHGGDPEHLTFSSDAYLTSPGNLIGQLRTLVTEHGWPLERVLPFVTTNTARVLKLERKGRIAPGKSADLVVMRRDSLAVVDVISGGRRLVRDGRVAFKERFLEDSNRRICLVGKKAEETS
jgi:beta-aspartyl-dipeptidase (metallo-type)